MAGYLIVLDSDIIDRTLFEEFRKQVEAAVKAQGGRYLLCLSSQRARLTGMFRR